MTKILKLRQAKNGATNREAIETTGEIFSDGTMLELIRPDFGTEEMSLLRWNGKSATIGQHFEGRILNFNGFPILGDASSLMTCIKSLAARS